MRYKYVVILGSFMLFINCATVKPIQIENGLYVNPLYQFSLRYPKNWEGSENIPDIFNTSSSFLSRKNFKAAFYDLNNQSFLWNHKTVGFSKINNLTVIFCHT